MSVPGPAGTGQEEEFGQTWWGRAWLEALEQRARLDPDRLPRGRQYARSGAVGELTLAPGEARARVGNESCRRHGPLVPPFSLPVCGSVRERNPVP